MPKFNININCVVFGVSEQLNKRCVLSTDKNNIIFPKLCLTNDHTDDINKSIISFLKQHIFVSDIELIPQMINVHSKLLQTDPNTLEMVYGFIVGYNNNVNPESVFWIDFDILEEQSLSPILFEVIQKLS